MSFDKVIVINTIEGHEYKIGFSIFDSLIIPKSISKQIVDVVIAIDDNKGVNNLKTLFLFSKQIKEYLIENDVIIYCYCDTKTILKGKNNEHLSNQEFRSSLFRKMFEREVNSTKLFLNKSIILTDINLENHYIHLFSSAHNKLELDKVEAELDKLNK